MCDKNKNRAIYDAVRSCPLEAQKPIKGGRLSGKTDINPMWRIKVLTETFGPCGFGWTTETRRMWIEHHEAESTANVEIALRVKLNDQWSEPIVGIGGAMFVSKEKQGLFIDDECYKKAYTDAISVACKALGVAADIYWASDSTKYDRPTRNEQLHQATTTPQAYTLRESFFDKRDKLENMLSQMEQEYRAKPESFTLLRFLTKRNIQVDNEDVMARLREIWMHHINEKGI